MGIGGRRIRIAVIEDNEFYNNLLTIALRNHITSLPYDEELDIEINSYTNPQSALEEMDPQTDIVFLDYYLGDSITGIEVLKEIKKQIPSCEVVIISQIKNSQTSHETLVEGANDFIHKDASAIAISCHAAAYLIYQKLGRIR